jgi:hypothetical protein
MGVNLHLAKLDVLLRQAQNELNEIALTATRSDTLRHQAVKWSAELRQLRSVAKQHYLPPEN